MKRKPSTKLKAPPTGPKRKPGPPPGYRPEFDERARKACLLGATNQELAGLFGVSDYCIEDWLRKYPAFAAAVKSGRRPADEDVASALYLKATGKWTQPAVKIVAKIETYIGDDGRPVEVKSEHIVHYTEHFPPDTAAAFIWLKNRQPGLWRDRKEIHGSGDFNVNHTKTVRLEFSPADRALLDALEATLFQDDTETDMKLIEQAAPPEEDDGVPPDAG
jgi:hypothetical protein